MGADVQGLIRDFRRQTDLLEMGNQLQHANITHSATRLNPVSLSNPLFDQRDSVFILDMDGTPGFDVVRPPAQT